MTGQHAKPTAAAAESFKQWQIHQTVQALKAHSEAVRIVCDIREWVDSQQHLIDTCAYPECPECETRRSLLANLARRLPAPSESGPGGGAHVDSNSRGDDREW